MAGHEMDVAGRLPAAARSEQQRYRRGPLSDEPAPGNASLYTHASRVGERNADPSPPSSLFWRRRLVILPHSNPHHLCC